MPQDTRSAIRERVDLSSQPITARFAGAGSMRREIEAVLGLVPDEAEAADYRRAILEENAARKVSQNARTWAWLRLKLRYSLDTPEASAFRDFRRAMRDPSPAGRGLACTLMLARNDRLFRETTLEILSPLLPRPGSIVAPEAVLEDIRIRMKAATLDWSAESQKSVSSHILSSWRELGLIEGVKQRRTLPVQMTYHALRFAVELGRATGLSDRQAMSSAWFQLFSLSLADVEALLYGATRAGVLGYRSQADVVEIDLPEDD